MFDTVDISILIKKIELAGLRDEVLDWCMSYLTNRQQCTIANNVTSSTMPVVCGLPQGSVLGPLFFLLHVYVTHHHQMRHKLHAKVLSKWQIKEE